MLFRFLLVSLCLAFAPTAQAQSTPISPQSIAEGVDTAGFTPTIKSELESFYALRGNQPAWNLSDDQALRKTSSFFDSIENLARYHGLLTTRYQLDRMRELAASRSDADKEKLELLITASLLRLAHDLHGDSVNLDKLYTGWNFKRPEIDVPGQINAAINDGTIGTYFDKLPPTHKMYTDLAHSLEQYAEMDAQGGWKPIAPGRALQPHDHDPRVTQVRARLVAEGYTLPPAPNGDTFFDDALSKTLITYQDRNGLSPDGHLGPKTLEALNVPLKFRLDQIRANMERRRHMPDDFPAASYTFVNIPDFSVTIVEDGALVYRGIVIDGKPDRQTPFIDSTITHMLINPSWHVPVSIAVKDILPKLRKDKHYLEKMDVVIAGREQDPSGTTIDWKNMSDSEFNYKLRQNPGDLNSLGQLKFDFANPFDVYMHGTPHQELFSKAERDFSSGCVRLEDPVRVAEIFLAHNKVPAKDGGGAWDTKHIMDAIAADQTIGIALNQPVPIYFLYWSVFSDEDGQINFRKDIYDLDALLTEKMNDLETHKL